MVKYLKMKENFLNQNYKLTLSILLCLRMFFLTRLSWKAQASLSDRLLSVDRPSVRPSVCL